jgi:hypothetical protein
MRGAPPHGQLVGVGDAEPIPEQARGRVDVPVGQRSGVETEVFDRQGQGLDPVRGLVDVAGQVRPGKPSRWSSEILTRSS